MRNVKNLILLFFVASLVCGLLSCQTMTKPEGPIATLEVIPPETFLSPALIKAPVSFKGTGFDAGEMISVEMVLPPGMTMKGIEEGANVGIAFGNADADGNFSAAMAPTATLNWFFQVGWTPLIKPDFTQAKPLPPGDYKILATGLESDRMATAILKLIPPPKQ
jgi:hypothetical protein